MKITKEFIEKHLKNEELLKKRIEEVFLKEYNIRRGYPLPPTEKIVDSYIDEGKAWVETEEDSVCGCCGSDHYWHDFPMEYLYSETWEEELKEEIARLKEQDEKEKAKREEKRKLIEEEKERKMFEELKEKYD